MVEGRTQGRPRARRRLQPPPARRHPEAQGADRRGPARTPVLRQGLVAAPDRHPHGRQLVHAPRLAGGGPLVDIGVHVLDWSLFLLGDPQVVAVSASTYDLLATTGFGPAPRGLQGKTGAGDGETPHFDVEDLASVFMRLAGGGTLLVEAELGRPPPRRRRVRHHPLRHGRRRGAHRRRLRAEGRAAALHRRRRPGGRQPRARQARPCPHGGHRAVRGQDPRRGLAPVRRVGRRRPGPRGRRLLPLSRRAARDPARFLCRRSAPAARGWASAGAAPVASRRRPRRARRSPSSTEASYFAATALTG